MGLLIDEVMRHVLGPLDPPHVVIGHRVIEYVRSLLPRDETGRYHVSEDADIPLLFTAPQHCPWPMTWVEFPMHETRRMRGVMVYEIEGEAFRAMTKRGPLPRYLTPLGRSYALHIVDWLERHGERLEGYERAFMFHVSVFFAEENLSEPAGYGISARDRDGIILSDGSGIHGGKNVFAISTSKNKYQAEYAMAMIDLAHMIIGLFHVRGMEIGKGYTNPKAIQARLKRKRPVTVEYTTVGFPGVKFGSRQEERAAQGVIPAHMVRGHFKDHTEHGLFNDPRRKMLVWVDMFVRGNPAQGVRLSEHAAYEPTTPIQSGQAAAPRQ